MLCIHETDVVLKRSGTVTNHNLLFVGENEHSFLVYMMMRERYYGNKLFQILQDLYKSRVPFSFEHIALTVEFQVENY